MADEWMKCGSFYVGDRTWIHGNSELVGSSLGSYPIDVLTMPASRRPE
jgi:hypothetical protein